LNVFFFGTIVIGLYGILKGWIFLNQQNQINFCSMEKNYKSWKPS
jgi:hypothetical protein